MSAPNDFYAMLSVLLKQIAISPETPPAVPLHRWPAKSQERRLLEDLQEALTALQSRDQKHSSQTEERELRYKSIYELVDDGLILNDLETGQVVEANPSACMMYGYPRDEFIGKHPGDFVHPDSYRDFLQYVERVRSQGMDFGLQIHQRQDGSQFHVGMNGTLYKDQSHSYVLSVVRDVSKQVQAERLLQQRVEERTREQATLLEISQTLASALELQPHLILDQLKVIIDYAHAGLFTLEDSALVAMAVRGPQRLEQAMPFKIQLGDPEALAVLFNGKRPSRIADIQSADPLAQHLRSLLVGQASVLLEEIQAWMWVPLAIKGRVIGAVGVAHAKRNYFTAHHADLALIVANQAAITMVNAELYEHAKTLAALQERQRLARNLHDAVNQSLFSAGLIAEVLPRLWERDPDEGRRSLEDLRRLTRGAQADMRLLLAELRPSTLTDAEFGDLLGLLVNALAGRTNIPIHVMVVGEGKLPANVKVALYRLCQEGLNNIAKHAAASQVDIQLQYETNVVELRIRDDGQGFDPELAVPGHYGLSMMRERATDVGATLTVTSQPGHGTEIVVRWVKDQEQKTDS